MDTTYQVDVRRDGRWWFFQIPAIDLSGQARKLSEVEFEATDIIATWLQVPHESVAVSVNVDVPEAVSAAWEEAKRLEGHAREENVAAGRLARQAVQLLRSEGMSQADTSQLLGVSVQRVSQLETTQRRVDDDVM